MKVLALAAALLGSVGSVAAAAETLPSVIRLGVINDQSGPYAASSGPGTAAAARLAVKDFGGTVLGRPVEIVVGDNQTKPDIASVIVKRWMGEGVAAIVDGGSSAAVLATLHIAKEADRAFVFSSPSSTALTNEECSEVGAQFTYDSYALAKALVGPTLQQGGDSWFFITANYAGGTSIEDAMTGFIRAGGGKVLGSVRHPIGASDFSSFLLQARSSGAKVIGLVNFGADLANTLKQAAEFGVGASADQRFAIPLIFLDDIKAVGLGTLPSLLTGISFYWDLTDETRAFAKRFAAEMNGQYPEETHAGAYSAVLHYLKGAQAAGSLSGKAVVEKMKEIPVNDFWNKNVAIRPDGRVLHDFHLVRLKAKQASRSTYDVFDVLATVPGADAYQPLSESRCRLVRKP